MRLAPLIVLISAAAVLLPSCASLEGTRLSDARAETVARGAKGMLKRSYKYGSLDCSALAQGTHARAGIEIPRTAAEQYAGSRRVGRAKLRNGDLVFFSTNGRGASHVGVYIGDGVFVHAPSSGKTVRTDRLDDEYWKKHYVGAGRFDFRPAPPARVPQRGPTLVAGRKSS